MTDLNESTFQRCPHDKEHPFVIVSRDLIRDMSISPDCRWLIIYLLSNAEGFQIKAATVINHVKPHMGRDRVYAVIDEAIRAGYMKRVAISRQGLQNGYEYYVSETPKFKECLRRPENQYTENTHSKEEAISSKEDRKEQTNSEVEQFAPLFVCSPEKERVIEKLCAENKISPSLRYLMYKTDEQDLFDAIEAWKQYMQKEKVDNPVGALNRAILQRWKPNAKERDFSEDAEQNEKIAFQVEMNVKSNILYFYTLHDGLEIVCGNNSYMVLYKQSNDSFKIELQGYLDKIGIKLSDVSKEI